MLHTVNRPVSSIKGCFHHLLLGSLELFLPVWPLENISGQFHSHDIPISFWHLSVAVLKIKISFLVIICINPFLPFLSAFPTELFRRSKPRASETFLMDTLSGIFTPHRFWIRVWMKIEKMKCYMESKSNYLKPMKLTKIKNNPIYHSKMSNFLDFLDI